MKEIVFTQETLEELLKAVGWAVANDNYTVTLDGEEIQVEAAKALIRYLKRKLGED